MAIGIELHPTAIRAVVLERPATSRLKLLAAEEIPCDTANPDALTRALTRLRQSLRIHHPVILGMPSSSTILTSIQPLIVNPHRAELAVQFELQQHMPFQLPDAAWHYQWLSEGNGHTAHSPVSRGLRAAMVGTPGDHGRAAVVAAMRRSLLEERLASCQRAGVRIEAVAVNAVGVLNAWAWQRPSVRSVAELMQGAASTTTSDVVLLNLMTDRCAEWILWTHDTLQVVPMTCESSAALGQDLAASWQAISTQWTEAPGRVWVVGSPIVWAAVRDQLTAGSSWAMERFDVTTLVTASATRADRLESCVAAVGLALQQLGLARLPINLLAQTHAQQRVHQQRRVVWAVGGLLGMIALTLCASGMMETHRQRMQLLNTLEQRQQHYQSLRPDIRALLLRQQQLQRRIDQLEHLVHDSPVVTALFAHIADALPETVWLTKAELGNSDQHVEGLLEGRAKSFPDVTDFFEQLKRIVGVTNLKPLSTAVTTDPDTGKEIVTFSVQLQRATPLAPADSSDTLSSS